jgi:hypothetical protein
MHRNYFIQRLLIVSMLAVSFFLVVPKTHAASLTSVSDTVTTSRPSSAATLSVDLVAGATGAVVGDKGDMFLASDSAVIFPDLGETLERLTVASGSASGVPIVTQKTVYFTTGAGSSHHIGDVVVVPVTATHLIQFNTASGIPNGGHITITFPTVANNVASPSATGFSFNGLAIGNVQCYPTTACGGTGQSVSGNTITLTTTAATSGTVYIAIGCNSTMTSGICPAGGAAPALINPIVSSTQCAGQTCTAGQTNDIWKINVQTSWADGSNPDTGRASVATIESVQVQAQIEPTMSFSITGLNTGVDFSGQASQCGSELTNTGINSTATSINLGVLLPTQISKAGQTLVVTTNQAFGYTIQATSSGSLLNAGSGITIPDANGGSLTSNLLPAPATIAFGTPAFGISPCGVDVPTAAPNWGGTGVTLSSGARLANPWNTPGNSFGMTLATYTGGTSLGTAGTHGVTVVRYGAAISSTTASGLYTTTLTYTATPSF